MADNTAARTLEQAKLDAQFGALFHTLNAKLFRRIHRWILATKVISGSAVFSLIFKGVDPTWGVVGAVVLVLMVTYEVVWQPIEHAFLHECFTREYTGLLRRDDLNGLQAFDRALAAIHDDGVGLEGLATVAYNRNVTSEGFESYIRPLEPWPKFLSALV